MASLKRFISLLLWLHFLWSFIPSKKLIFPKSNKLINQSRTQTKEKDKPSYRPLVDQLPRYELMITPVDIVASYPEGETAMLQLIHNNIKLPRDFCGGGVTVVNFVINEQGHPSDYRILRSIGEPIDKAVLKVIKRIKKWKPAKRMGKPVKSTYTIPVRIYMDT